MNIRPLRGAAIAGLFVTLLIVSASESPALTLPTDLQPIAASDIPRTVCNYYSIQKLLSWPPAPCNWLADQANVELYVSPSLGTNVIFVGDMDVDYTQLQAENQLAAALLASAWANPASA